MTLHNKDHDPHNKDHDPKQEATQTYITEGRKQANACG